jgi:hypothetical protein
MSLDASGLVVYPKSTGFIEVMGIGTNQARTIGDYVISVKIGG